MRFHRAPTDEPFVHPALFYRDPHSYLAGCVPFIEDGIRAGEPVLVAVPAANLELLRAAVPFAPANVTFADMTAAGRNPGRIIPWVLNAFLTEHAGNNPRVIGEPIWAGRTPDEYPACVVHESLINAAFTGRAATILCPYDTTRLRPEVVDDALRTHPTIIEQGHTRNSRSYTEPAQLVDRFNRPLPDPPGPAATLMFGTGGLPLVHRFVAEHAAVAGLPANRLADLQSAVRELAANTITHTPNQGTLRMWQQRGSVVCEVSDSGHIPDLLAGRLPPEPGVRRGRGLLIVNDLVDLVRMHTAPGRTTIRLYLAC